MTLHRLSGPLSVSLGAGNIRAWALRASRTVADDGAGKIASTFDRLLDDMIAL
jgi:hypothetical protein